MKYSFLPAFVVLSIIVSGQTIPPILTASKPARGIYRTFNDFLNNAPSIYSPFQVVCKSGDRKVERGTADYWLVLFDSLKRPRKMRQFWGVSDGESIYVNEGLYGGRLNFKKLLGLGRYCYFKGSVPTDYATPTLAGGVVLGAATAVAVEIDGDYPYILNINNGNFFLLDKKTLGMILKRDTELQLRFEEEDRKSKRNTLLSYIVKYNERHEDEITFNKPDTIDVVIYRRQKKEKPVSFTLMAGDTLQLSIAPNSLNSMAWMNDSLEICAGAACKTFGLVRKRTNYIECSWKESAPEFKLVEPKVGEFYRREILLSNEKEK